MAGLLYIEASPRKERSASIAVARAFPDECVKSHPEDAVDGLDLRKERLPVFHGLDFKRCFDVIVQPAYAFGAKPENARQSLEAARAAAAAGARSF